MAKALLFVNGEPPKNYPTDLSQYQYIACTDGAYHNYLTQTDITPNFIIGDFDSLQNQPIDNRIDIIHTPDQSKTDFEKALLFLANKGIHQFDIYGANGHASDHFLGNISVAMRYYHIFELRFYDNYCDFFFAKKFTTLNHVKDKTISLIPLSEVKHLTITGFKYPLTNETINFNGLISLRNQAIDDLVTISFEQGDLLVFISTL
ncbi:thiamine pyrophosphokinase [Orbus hercynius]|uniref:Thiamine diphosphokinase n=1 Tax=Orbus hercynius TaxID=593135 RepID=A0A495RK89_9GAMM|nr:thiamine diphosphokinase [Orbus hercynius]RKS87769.1 thiamine pyrophosphokinase [Orbus hercynius]